MRTLPNFICTVVAMCTIILLISLAVLGLSEAISFIVVEYIVLPLKQVGTIRLVPVTY